MRDCITETNKLFSTPVTGQKERKGEGGYRERDRERERSFKGNTATKPLCTPFYIYKIYVMICQHIIARVLF